MALAFRPARPRSSGGARGTSLLEAIAAVALSSVMLSSALAALGASIGQFRNQRTVNGALDLARTRLETAIAVACVAPQPCPQPFDCRLEREVALRPNVERHFWVIRLRSIVTAKDRSSALGALAALGTLGNGITLDTLVARARPCAS